MLASLLDRPDDGGEVVVEEHQIGHLAADVGPALPHRHADIGPLERGRVVDTVARHGHDLALRLQRLDQPQLLLGAHPGEHVHLAERPSRGASALQWSRSSPVRTRGPGRPIWCATAGRSPDGRP